MTVERILDADDPRLADYRGVGDPELLRVRGLFVAEGRLVVQRAIEDGRYAIRSVLVSDAAHRSLESSLARVAADVPIYICEAGAFLGISGYNLHRGCLALVARPGAASVDDVLMGAKTVVVLEGVTNADNVGAVFRDAAAFGANVLLSPTCCDPLYRKAIRTSMASSLRVPYARIEEWPRGLADLRSGGFTSVALTPRQPSMTLVAFARRRPERLALLVGTEGAGLTPAVEAAADARVRIPISSAVDSLNVGVAVGIALHALTVTGE